MLKNAIELVANENDEDCGHEIYFLSVYCLFFDELALNVIN